VREVRLGLVRRSPEGEQIVDCTVEVPSAFAMRVARMQLVDSPLLVWNRMR
jgi:hypothetical protein